MSKSHVQGTNTYKNNVSQSKGWIPILLQSIDTDLSIVCNIWVEDFYHKIPCSPNYLLNTQLYLLVPTHDDLDKQ